MAERVLIVEDELIIALDLEDMITDMGHQVVGLASNLNHAVELAPNADIALVDVNLSDGASGPEIGRLLAENFGISVVFMTGNAEKVAAGIKGTIGVVSKPITLAVVRDTLEYVSAHRENKMQNVPDRLKLFSPGSIAAE